MIPRKRDRSGLVRLRRNGVLLIILIALSLVLFLSKRQRFALESASRSEPGLMAKVDYSVIDELRQAMNEGRLENSDEAILASILRPQSPVIPIEVLSCPRKTEHFHEDILLPRATLKTSSPLDPKDFVCQAQCAIEEPELKESLRYFGGNVPKYSDKLLRHLCARGHVPLLIAIRNNRAYFAKCATNGRLKASHVFFTSVIRTLFVLTRLVRMPDIVFAFDNSDFSRPTTSDPNGNNWNYVVPGVVRFVGDAAHPSLLWPTAPYIRATSYCGFDKDDKMAEEFSWIQRAGGCVYAKPNKPWGAKMDTVFWRGSPTGTPIDDEYVQFMPRAMLNARFKDAPGYDVAFLKHAVPPYANERFMREHLWASGVEKSEFGDYKMVLSLDGHTASWGLIERLGIGSVLLVHESLRGYREHYYRLMRPYVHYIPVAFDFSNIERVRQFVLSPEGSEKAKQITEQAVELMTTRMRPQDLWCYLYRLLATLATKQGFDASNPSLFGSFSWQEITPELVQKYAPM